MDFNNFVRGFFGLRPPKGDSYNDDCENCSKCQWPKSSEDGMHLPDDTIFRDEPLISIVQPLDPFSIFQQMEDAFSHFFSFHSSRMLDFPLMEEPDDDHESHRDILLNPSEKDFGRFFWEDHHHRGDSEFPSVESFRQPENARDHMLKPEKGSLNSMLVRPARQQDSDLDGSVLKDEHSHDSLKEFSQQPRISTNWSFRKSVSVRTVRGADGTLEEHRTVRDSSGNEVTTVRKSIGDQSYSVTLHKDSEGLKEKKEDLINLDEKDILQFEEKWHNMKDNFHHTPKSELYHEPDSLIKDAPGDPYYSSIFKKLFRF